MSTARRGAGRGTSRRAAAAAQTESERSTPAPLSRLSSVGGTPDTYEGGPVEDDDVQMQDAPTADDTRTQTSTTTRRQGTRTMKPTIEKQTSRVGGMLQDSEFKRKPTTTATTIKPNAGAVAAADTSSSTSTSGGVTRKLSFKPNMKRRQVVRDDDSDEDTKPDIGSNSFQPRERRAREPRTQHEMMATGPMAQGPGGAPKLFGGKPVRAAEGGGVMEAARRGIITSNFDDDGTSRGIDDSSSGSDNDDEDATARAIRPRDLNKIGNEDEMAPLVLPRDPDVTRRDKARRQAKKEEKAKKEEQNKREPELIKPDPEDDGSAALLSSTNATPAFELESKTGSMTIDSKEPTVEPDVEDKPVDLTGAFVHNGQQTRDPLYIFQFPRKFPQLVDETTLDSDLLDVKPETVDTTVASANVNGGGGGGSSRRRVAPDWGRIGSRQNKASRWPQIEGQIGKLVVRKSGKVILKINKDVKYEVLPAAQPNFLQEVAVLDHNPQDEPGYKQQHQQRRGRDEEDVDMQDTNNNAILILGQTDKKFLIVPDVDDLLDKVEQQERQEKKKVAELKAVKKEKR
ncbi:hypothetical protein OIO90_005657 [Microbotryomycetes sp. JL221]|nr:hypothetical protein OIO90_005657 [Microbotryomycetes sp. JL221]